MNPPFDATVGDDAAALREIFSALDRLDAAFDDARERYSPRQRGYFTPDEDDHVRQMLLLYRNLRAALYGIVSRYRGFGDEADPLRRLRGFVVGYAAALRLYRKSLKLTEATEKDAFLRAKLNEPDARFGLDAGFFDQVLAGISSLRNYWAISRAGAYWIRNRRLAGRLGLDGDEDVAWLINGIAADRNGIQGLFWRTTARRVARDWRLAWRIFFSPVGMARYGSQTLIASLLSSLRLPHHESAIGETVIGQIESRLQPGDVMLVRAEDKVTSALLPGFWAHAAIYLGTEAALRDLGFGRSPASARVLATMARIPGPRGYVLEAIPRGVIVNPLETSLRADHLAVLRPGLDPDSLRSALEDAMGHLGKPYDFEFDFNVSSRIVCTELVYRAFHARGGIEFKLTKRLGRWTLSADDLMDQAREGHSAGMVTLVPLMRWGPGSRRHAEEKNDFFGVPGLTVDYSATRSL